MEGMPSLMIATPTGVGGIKTNYLVTLVGTIADLTRRGLDVTFHVLEGAAIARQRNVLATQFLASDRTHLFFVDADMAFDGGVCHRLLSHDKPLIGAVYKTKRLESVENRWLAHFGAETVRATNGIVPVDLIAAGCLLIRRDVLETMVARGVKRQQDGDESYYNFFTVRPEDAAEGQHVSEDFSFSRRWTIDCNGEIWALVDARIGHVGDYVYGADRSYLEAMLAERKATRA
jgi:hypothetical protein